MSKDKKQDLTPLCDPTLLCALVDQGGEVAFCVVFIVEGVAFGVRHRTDITEQGQKARSESDPLFS